MRAPAPSNKETYAPEMYIERLSTDNAPLKLSDIGIASTPTTGRVGREKMLSFVESLLCEKRTAPHRESNTATIATNFCIFALARKIVREQ
mmetsp:Transcript_9204/g.25747  ORF Transcript_9204/g.25747 Transcript_9204/m.25747 type:complete len:91 (-) Transcript_9204:12-284(-)